MKRTLLSVPLACAAASILVIGCSDSRSGDASTTTQPFVMTSAPEFVNRIIPGHRPLAIVSVAGTAGDPALLSGTSSLEGVTVSFQPQSIATDASSEVWVDVPEVTEEVPFTVTVRATLGNQLASVTIDATAIPGVDDVAEVATQIAAVFLDRVHDQIPGLPSEASGLINGTPVAGLLVVTHYAWFTEKYEIGLAWHIMVAPDDFAELYVRPRGQRSPTHTFRINSWSTALQGGAYQLTEVPNTEVTR